MENKSCTKCGLEKPLTEFYKRLGDTTAKCKICIKSEMKERYVANPEKDKEYSKKNIENFTQIKVKNILNNTVRTIQKKRKSPKLNGTLKTQTMKKNVVKEDVKKIHISLHGVIL